MCTVVQAASGLSLDQSTTSVAVVVTVGGAEWHKGWTWPFMDSTVAELPGRAPVAAPFPVDGSSPECAGGQGAEGDPSTLVVAPGKPPGLDEQVLAKVWEIVSGNAGSNSRGDACGESLGVGDVMQLQRH